MRTLAGLECAPTRGRLPPATSLQARSMRISSPMPCLHRPTGNCLLPSAAPLQAPRHGMHAVAPLHDSDRRRTATPQPTGRDHRLARSVSRRNLTTLPGCPAGPAAHQRNASSLSPSARRHALHCTQFANTHLAANKTESANSWASHV
jgi:hypothetical protein